MHNYALKPYVLSLRTTERCNTGCFHCSLGAKPTGRDMPLDMGVDAIRTAAEHGIGLLHLSGGEPLLYPELPDLIVEAKEHGMQVEMVTSTFTANGAQFHEHRLLKRLVEAGLDTILLSYDDGHAKTVSMKRFSKFVNAATHYGLRICIFAIKSQQMAITAEKILHNLTQHGVSIEGIDFASAIYSFTGRGASRLARFGKNLEPIFSRCPYVIPVPTLTPEGTILLCPCSIMQSDHFIVGDTTVRLKVE